MVLSFRKIKLSKLSVVFRVFEYALCQETKTQKRQKSTKGVLNQKILIVSSYHYQETTEKLPIWYLSTILASITRKTSFKLHYNADVDNFDQYFESCAINAHKAQKSAANNNVKNLKNLKRTMIFRVFLVFEYAAYAFFVKAPLL